MAAGERTRDGADTIILSLPCGPDFTRVAMLVVGGLAVRLNLTFEHLEDLEIAVGSLLAQARDGEEVTLRLEVREHGIVAAVGPVDGDAVRTEIADEEAAAVGLRRVLQTVTDGFDVVERDGVQWLSFEKRAGAREENGAG